MTRPATFDILAPGYDSAFTNTHVGVQQRLYTRKWLEKFLAGKPALQILEINCGTGEDAQWLAAMGHTVTATDASEAMIEAGKQKSILRGNPVFMVCPFEELGTRFLQQRFDLIFSNFSGLNCVDPAALRQLNQQLHDLLNERGYLAVVVFGKYTWWESFYFLLKADLRNACRRWSNKKVMVPLDANTQQPVYYYSSHRLGRMLASFRKIEKRPVGLFIPPSYLEGLMRKNPRLFRLLVKLENLFGAVPSFSALADHTYLLFKKVPS
jgi:ubiquinone/menaquinone biosynthesis C-methylase UbiE